MQRIVEVDISTRLRLVHILSIAIITWDGDLDTTLQRHNLISVDFNMLPMFMLECIHNASSKEIEDLEATTHDQMVSYKWKIQSAEGEVQ